MKQIEVFHVTFNQSNMECFVEVLEDGSLRMALRSDLDEELESTFFAFERLQQVKMTDMVIDMGDIDDDELEEHEGAEEHQWWLDMITKERAQ